MIDAHYEYMDSYRIADLGLDRHWTPDRQAGVFGAGFLGEGVLDARAGLSCLGRRAIAAAFGLDN